jgi:hypothetical protein
MSGQPQEWADKAYAAIQDDNDNRPTLDILREHFNAALAAERENWKVAVGNLATMAKENAEQLAAERKKVNALVEALEKVQWFDGYDGCHLYRDASRIVAGALAQVKEAK